MEHINIFFIIISVVMLIYLVASSFNKKRVGLSTEIFFLLAYAFIAFLFIFPGSLSWIEDLLGIPSAINFFLYLAIFTAYFLILKMYRKTEEQRQEITQLTREIAILKAKKK